MKLYFLRHGLAGDPSEWSGPDSERPLTREGRARMAHEAKAMSGLGMSLDAILSSPLLRAKQTAQIVADALKLRHRLVEEERLDLEFSFERLSAIVQDRRGAEALMLVGHEPSMSDVIGRLIGGARLDFKKGSLARVDLFETATLHGRLVWLAAPKILVSGR